MKTKRAKKSFNADMLDINTKLYTHIIKHGHKNVTLNKRYARRLINQTQSLRNNQYESICNSKYIMMYEWYKN
ncbi:MAG: hypothetical protein J0L69_08650 [Bacteroidetes bacterium]|nr:hypothetical protein [Bacteroidota bacterium]